MSRPSSVRVHLFPLDAPDPLREAFARTAGIPRDSVRISRWCARCGSETHGRPLVSAPRAASGDWHVSLSRSLKQVAVAVTDAAPIGVDIESLARLERAPVDGVLLHPLEEAELRVLEQDERLERLAELWTAKEAVVKALGVGLRVELSLLRVGGSGADAALLEWPPDLSAAPMRLRTVRLENGERLAVALVADGGIRLDLEQH